MILRILGSLLLAAAGLKLYGLAVEPVGATGIFSEPWVQTLIIDWELLLGIWLLWGINSGAAWLAATITFLGFAGVSFWQGWIGQTTCGCLGTIHVNPWLALGIDVSVLGILTTTRCREPLTLAGIRLRPLFVGACAVLAILGVLAGVAMTVFGSAAAALAFLRDEHVSVEPRFVDMGHGAPGVQKEATVVIRNWTQQHIRVVGAQRDWSWRVRSDLPLVVPPQGAAPLSIAVNFGSKTGQFTHVARVYLDDGYLTGVPFRVIGRVVPESGTVSGTGN